MSLPCATGTSPAATAAADPPLDPPVLRVRSHGLCVAPYASGSVVHARRELGRIGLADEHEPRGPEARREPRVVGLGPVARPSARACRSGTDRPRCGTPRPSRGTARRGAAPAAAEPASSRARSKRSWMTALSCGFRRSMRAIAASTSSRALTSPRATSSACAVASRTASSSLRPRFPSGSRCVRRATRGTRPHRRSRGRRRRPTAATARRCR